MTLLKRQLCLCQIVYVAAPRIPSLSQEQQSMSDESLDAIMPDFVSGREECERDMSAKYCSVLYSGVQAFEEAEKRIIEEKKEKEVGAKLQRLQDEKVRAG